MYSIRILLISFFSFFILSAHTQLNDVANSEALEELKTQYYTSLDEFDYEKSEEIIAQIKTLLPSLDNRDKAIVLMCECDFHVSYENYREAITACSKSLEILPQPEAQLAAKVKNLLANAYTYVGELDSAEVIIKSYLYDERVKDKHFLSAAHYALTTIYEMREQDDLVLKELLMALKLSTENGDLSHAATLKSYLGETYSRMDNDSLALAYQKDALEYFKEFNEPENAGFVYMTRSNIYRDLEQYEKALVDLEAAVQIGKEVENAGMVANSLSATAEILNKQGKYAEAIAPNEESLSICQEYQIPIGITSCLECMTNSYIGLGEYAKAKEFALQCKENAEKYDFSWYRIRSGKSLSEIYENLGDYNKALEFYREATALNDSIYTAEKVAKLGQLREEFEREKNEAEVKRLSTEKQLSDLKLIGAIVLIAVILIAAVVILSREQKRRKQAKKLHETEMKLSLAEQEKLQELVQTKNRELMTSAMNMARKNEFINDLNKELESLSQSAKIENSTKVIKQKLKLESQLDDYWDQFSKTFTEVNSDFYSTLNGTVEGITKSELRLASLLKMNLSSKEIANILNISTEGVKKARYRLRKKLELNTEDSLNSYLAEL